MSDTESLLSETPFLRWATPIGQGLSRQCSAFSGGQGLSRQCSAFSAQVLSRQCSAFSSSRPCSPLLEAENAEVFSRSTTPGEPPRAEPEPLVIAIFGVAGLASDVLWNQVMLSVGLLVRFFGDSILAEAALVQNVLCFLSMAALTLMPTFEVRTRAAMAMLANATMVLLAFVLAWLLTHGDIERQTFLRIVACIGACVGCAQNLAASLSGSFEGAAAAMLLGESCSQPTTVAVSLLWLPLALGDAQATAGALCSVALVLVAAALGLSRLPGVEQTLTGPPCDTMGSCVAAGGELKGYVVRRCLELVGNAFVTFAACLAWVATLCASPYLATGLCGDDASCQSQLPTLLLGVGSFAASAGRGLGVRDRGGARGALLALEACALLALALWSLRLLATAPPVMALAWPRLAAAGATVGLTVWSNLLLMRNDHAAHAGCSHSIFAPCPVTNQILWLAIQSGAIAGTFVTRLF